MRSARRGSNSIDVHLPQVTGGSAAVRDRFNSGMSSALDDLVAPSSDTTIEDGQLVGGERSQVTTITSHVVAGVAVFNSYAKGAAHPSNAIAHARGDYVPVTVAWGQISDLMTPAMRTALIP